MPMVENLIIVADTTISTPQGVAWGTKHQLVDQRARISGVIDRTAPDGPITNAEYRRRRRAL